VRVTRDGKPVAGVRVAWTTPALGAKTYIGTTDAQGVSSATQLYTSSTPGKFTEVAAIVPSSWSGGQWSDGPVPTEGAPVVFHYEQRDDAPPATVGTVKPYYSCSTTADCTPGNLCIDNHDNIFYCKPTCSTDADCAGNPYGAIVCKPLKSNANGAAIGRPMCQSPSDP